jgi:hypothetical protein
MPSANACRGREVAVDLFQVTGYPRLSSSQAPVMRLSKTLISRKASCLRERGRCPVDHLVRFMPSALWSSNRSLLKCYQTEIVFKHVCFLLTLAPISVVMLLAPTSRDP